MRSSHLQHRRDKTVGVGGVNRTGDMLRLSATENFKIVLSSLVGVGVNVCETQEPEEAGREAVSWPAGDRRPQSMEL